jgi:formate hydrogenlyase transcriptional activator
MTDGTARPLTASSPEAQHKALLEVAEAISQHRDLGDLFHELAARLHGVAEFDFLSLVLHDATRNVMRLHILETEEPKKIGPGLELQLSETPSGLVWETQQPLARMKSDLCSKCPARLP